MLVEEPMAWCGASGVSLRYEVSGRGRPSLLLAHELGGSLESWDAVAARLQDRFRILRWDQRGSGLSEKVRKPFSMHDHAADLEALATAAGIEPPFVLVGVAAGAAIALAFTLRQRDKVAGLMLCSPATEVAVERRGYLLERSERAARDGMAAIVETTLSRSYPPQVIKTQAIYDDYRARFLANDPVCYGFANRALAEIDFDPAEAAGQIPCLVLAGRYDLLRPPEQTEALARRIPRADFAVVESGHLMPVQAPEEMAARIASFAETIRRPSPDD